MASMLFVGCQKSLESVSEDGLRGDTRALASVSQNTYTATLWQTYCIGPNYHTQVSSHQLNASASNWKKIDAYAYNTETQFKVFVTYTRSNGTDVPTNLSVSFNGGSATLIAPTYGTPTEFTFSLPANWVKGQTVPYSITETGTLPLGGAGTLLINGSYNLIGVCTSTSVDADEENPVCVGSTVNISGEVTSAAAFTGGQIHIEQYDGVNWNIVASSAVGTKTVSYPYTPAVEGDATFRARFDGVSSNGFTSTSSSITVTAENCGCPESFTYEAGAPPNENNLYIFSYTPSETLTNATLVFTFAQGVVVAGLNDWTSNGVTKQKTFETLNACQTYTWEVAMAPNCSGNSGQSNIWTDFKVGTLQLVEVDGVEVEQMVYVSKKNTLTPTIQVLCP